MSSLYADEWVAPRVEDENDGACVLVIPEDDGNWGQEIRFDSPTTLRAWLAALNKAAETYFANHAT